MTSIVIPLYHKRSDCLSYQLELPADCREKRWCKEWLNREKNKDIKQGRLDIEFYQASMQRNWNETKRLFDLGATNDYVDFGKGGLSAFIVLYSFDKKEMIDQIIHKYPQEYERSTEVLLEIQKRFLKIVNPNDNPLYRMKEKEGPEEWIENWKNAYVTKDRDQRAKDAALWITCKLRKWELAAKWIDRGATNNFVNKFRRTSLHLAAKWKEGLIVVQKMLDRCAEDIERKDIFFQSPLRFAFASIKDQPTCITTTIAEIMVKKKAKYPILQLMLNERCDNNIEMGLSIINKWTDLENQLYTDFKFIKAADFPLCSGISKNMAQLIEVCTKNYNLSVTKVIKEILGKKMIVHDELTWRYGNGSKKSFVASFFKELKITGNFTLKKKCGKIMVHVIDKSFFQYNSIFRLNTMAKLNSLRMSSWSSFCSKR